MPGVKMFWYSASAGPQRLARSTRFYAACSMQVADLTRQYGLADGGAYSGKYEHF